MLHCKLKTSDLLKSSSFSFIVFSSYKFGHGHTMLFKWHASRLSTPYYKIASSSLNRSTVFADLKNRVAENFLLYGRHKLQKVSL